MPNSQIADDESIIPYFPLQVIPFLDRLQEKGKLLTEEQLQLATKLPFTDGSHLSKSISKLPYTIKFIGGTYYAVWTTEFSNHETRFGRKKNLARLGKGLYGKAKLVQNFNGNWAVLKVQRLTDGLTKERVENEYHALEKLGRGMGMAYRNVNSSEIRHYMVMPLAPGITLYGFIHSNTPLPYGEWLRVAYNLLLSYKTQIYDQGFTHNDMHTKNIMIDPISLEVTFIDFFRLQDRASNLLNQYSLRIAALYEKYGMRKRYLYSLNDFSRLIAILNIDLDVKFEPGIMTFENFENKFFVETGYINIEEYLEHIQTAEREFHKLYQNPHTKLSKLNIGILNLVDYINAFADEEEELLDKLDDMDEVWFLDGKRKSPEYYRILWTQLVAKKIAVGFKVIHRDLAAMQHAITHNEYPKKPDESLEIIGLSTLGLFKAPKSNVVAKLEDSTPTAEPIQQSGTQVHFSMSS